MPRSALAPLLSALLLGGCSRTPTPGPAPHQIRLVGAAAALPFTEAASETLMRDDPAAIAPLPQAGGNDAGIARFCGGPDRRHPDLAATTRPPTPAERAACARNGIADIAIVPLGWSALVLVARPDLPPLAPTRADLARALAGPAASWAAVDPRLPALAIGLHGPDRRLLQAGELGDVGAAVRRDTAYVGHGADADLVADAVAATPGAVGLVPYAYAVQNADRLRVLPLDGVMPTPATIADGRYPARLPLLLLVKTRSAPMVPAMAALLDRFAAGLAPGGGFAARGLVPLDRAAAAAGATRLRALGRGAAQL